MHILIVLLAGMTLRERIRRTRRWLREARDRYFGARINLRHVRRHKARKQSELHTVVSRLEHGDPQGDVREKLERRRKALREKIDQLDERQKVLSEQVKRREEVRRHLSSKLHHLNQRLEKRQEPEPDADGLATFDGKTVAAHFVPWLVKARANGWDGVVVSGYRTPEYSESLCYGMCGAPTCPGRCAGRGSSHSQKAPPPASVCGAIDVSDYWTMARVFDQIGAPYFNALPIDPVHFSCNGH
jgi:hypothetical protein